MLFINGVQGAIIEENNEMLSSINQIKLCTLLDDFLLDRDDR